MNRKNWWHRSRSDRMATRSANRTTQSRFMATEQFKKDQATSYEPSGGTACRGPTNGLGGTPTLPDSPWSRCLAERPWELSMSVLIRQPLLPGRSPGDRFSPRA
jgi:hypothetical protein